MLTTVVQKFFLPNGKLRKSQPSVSDVKQKIRWWKVRKYKYYCTLLLSENDNLHFLESYDLIHAARTHVFVCIRMCVCVSEIERERAGKLRRQQVDD